MLFWTFISIWDLFQNAYTQAVTIFLFVVLDLTGYLTIGDMNPRQPYLYLSLISLVSFMVGLWALFVFFNITHQFELLHDYKYRQKSGLLKAIVVLVNLQVYYTLIHTRFSQIQEQPWNFNSACWKTLHTLIFNWNFQFLEYWQPL